MRDRYWNVSGNFWNPPITTQVRKRIQTRSKSLRAPFNHQVLIELEMGSVDEIRDRFYGGSEQAREAFEELAAYAQQLEAERDEVHNHVQEKVMKEKEANAHLRDKLHRLREKYIHLVEMYNEIAEETKERSDSSSSSSSSSSSDSD